MARRSADPPAPSLRRLQCWFVSQLLGPDTPAAIRRESARGTAVDYIVPTSRQTARGRMANYAVGYREKIVSELEGAYPAVRAVLGSREFRRMAYEYARRHPPPDSSYARAVGRLPEFLSKSSLSRRRALGDVARLERAMLEVYDEPVPAPGPAFELRDRSRVRFIEALRVMRFDSLANEIVTAVEERRPVPRPARRRSWFVVYPRNGRVYRMKLDEAQYDALLSLRAGWTVGAALGGDPGMERWLRLLLQEGLISGVR